MCDTPAALPAFLPLLRTLWGVEGMADAPAPAPAPAVAFTPVTPAASDLPEAPAFLAGVPAVSEPLEAAEQVLMSGKGARA